MLIHSRAQFSSLCAKLNPILNHEKLILDHKISCDALSKLIIVNKPLLYYGAAFCTGLAGILHLMLIPNSINFINYAIFFLVSGVAQLLWVLPMIKSWGTIWYFVGIAGTAIMVGLTGYVIVSILFDPSTGRGGIIEMAIATEIFQIAYVVVTAIILHRERKLRMVK
jgi:hypothetical protein